MKKTPRKILVIDDDPNVIDTITRWLKVAGYEIISALNGEAGFHTAINENPDLILLDVRLPDTNGRELAKKFFDTEDTNNIPIIFITVTVGLELDKGNETINIDGRLYRVFAKPLHNPKLLSEIRKSINRRIHGNPFYIEGS